MSGPFNLHCPARGFVQHNAILSKVLAASTLLLDDNSTYLNVAFSARLRKESYSLSDDRPAVSCAARALDSLASQSKGAVDLGPPFPTGAEHIRPLP